MDARAVEDCFVERCDAAQVEVVVDNGVAHVGMRLPWDNNHLYGHLAPLEFMQRATFLDADLAVATVRATVGHLGRAGRVTLTDVTAIDTSVLAAALPHAELRQYTPNYVHDDMWQCGVWFIDNVTPSPAYVHLTGVTPTCTLQVVA